MDRENIYFKFVKKAVVYSDSVITGRYIDLFTNEKYYNSIYDTYEGQMYINLKFGLISLCNYYGLDIRFHEDLSEDVIKRKILSSKLLNKREDDK